MKNTNTTVNLLTAEGYKKIEKEIGYRETKLRDSLTDTLNEMRSQGDLSENDGFTMAVEQSEQNEEEITRLKTLLKNSKVVKRRSKTKVDIGSKVTIDDNGSGEKIFTIVGEDNTNPLENKISYKSPIGEALMKRKVGEKITLQTPGGEKICQIKAIN
ncbi:GreA/GreB family elongation factor [bacterium]|nr:GreA/GreB family elongation factor [bacterium]